MTHMIDMSNSRANIAFVGETPWHSLGHALPPDQPLEVWAQQAGLAHKVEEAPVQFNHGRGDGTIDSLATFKGKRVLYRSDNLKPLSVVSDGYQVVQPDTVLRFFEALCKHNQFTMETAGALDDGKRIWALAKVGEGDAVIGGDQVKPYVLLATSYDGTMATIAKLTSVRVVCHNTLSYAAGTHGSTEADAGSSVVRVSHSATFDPNECRLDLGIALDGFERFLIQARRLAKQPVNEAFTTAFLKRLLPAAVSVKTAKDGTKTVTPAEITESRAFRQIMGLFQGEAMGAGLPGAGGTAWGLLNAITQHVDWQRGRTDNSRMSSAWFGAGNALKDKARDLLLEVVS